MGKILAIGGVTIDRIGSLSRMPDWDDTEYFRDFTIQQGGMAATAMVAVARLRGEAEFMGGVGDDEAGRLVMETFTAEGVNSDRVKIFPGERTAESVVLVNSKNGRRTILHHGGVQEYTSLGRDDIALEDVTFLHLDGYWFDTALKTALRAKSMGVTVTMDPSSSLNEMKARKLFPLAEYVIPSHSYAMKLTGIQDPFEAAEVIRSMGARTVIVTHGEKGAYILGNDGRVHVPAFRIRPVDTTGAGDTFHGAFIYGLSIGYDMVTAVKFASAAAAIKCMRTGGQAGIPTFEETILFIKTNKNLFGKIHQDG